LSKKSSASCLIPADDNDQDASSLPHDAGEIRARLGQTERAVRLIGNSGIASVRALLAAAGKYPVAASLREQAWREAERVNELTVWQLLVEDAIERGDQAEISRAAQRAGSAIDRAGDGNNPQAAIPFARVLLTAGLTDLSAKLIKPWPQWVNGKEASVQFNTVNALIPVLAGLARDQDVQAAVRAVSDSSDRSRCSSKAAGEYFRLGRREIAEKFDAEALALAASPPTGETARRGDHGTALHNLALERADRGDIQGALAATAKLRDDTKVRDVTSWIIYRAIDGGHGPVAGPAIESLQQIAFAARDVGLLLRAAQYWYAIGNEDNARNAMSQAMKRVDAGQARLSGSDSGKAAELTWRLDGKGKAESIIGIVDKIGVTDPIAIDQLVEIIRPMSPAVAVQLAGRQSEVTRRIEELANIAIQVAATAK
jgi:tetratricopeptide (TPR) repeat protein